MHPIFLDFQVTGLQLQRIEFAPVYSENRNYIFARFALSKEWNGRTVIAIFSRKGIETVHATLEDGTCKVPNEFMAEAGTFTVSLTADDRLTTGVSSVEVKQSGFLKGIPPLPPEPTYIYIQSPGASVTLIRYDKTRSIFQGFTGGEWVDFGSGGGGTGSNGWTPIFAIVPDGEREVLQITEWVGGSGAPPETGYLSPIGIVSDITQASNVRGSKGDKGDMGLQGIPGIGLPGSPGYNGWSPVLAVIADIERRVQRLTDWTGGTGTKPTEYIGWYIGENGLVSNIALATDIRGGKGDKGDTGATGGTGAKGEKGQDGFSPTIEVIENTPETYKLEITDVNGPFPTPNLIGPTGKTGEKGESFDPETLQEINETLEAHTLNLTALNQAILGVSELQADITTILGVSE